MAGAANGSRDLMPAYTGHTPGNLYNQTPLALSQLCRDHRGVVHRASSMSHQAVQHECERHATVDGSTTRLQLVPVLKHGSVAMHHIVQDPDLNARNFLAEANCGLTDDIVSHDSPTEPLDCGLTASSWMVMPAGQLSPSCFSSANLM